MEHEPVVEQLRCAGVVAGITIARSVFPNNLSNSVALARYSYLWDVNRYPSAKTNDMTPEQKRAEDCKAMMNCVLKCKEQFVDGKCIKAFTVGKTKTYFRAGALEYLESNRMSGLDAQAIIIQRAARGWLARNRGKNANQRRKMLESERMQAAAERKAQMAREREERIAAQKAEEQELLDEIDQLEQSLRRVELEKTAAILKARERVEGAKRDLELAKEELVQQEEGEVKVRLMEKARQEKKLEENIKIIQMLKRENMRVLQSEANVREKVEKESSKINMLEEGNRSLGDNVDHISDEATEKMSKYESLQERVEDAKVSNRELKRQVHKQQDLYMEQAEARLTLQKTLAAILTNIQESSVDQNLVEEIVLVALGVESEAKSLMASLDFETSEPSLMASDISEGDDSHSS
jgi:myosin heavy subunit